MSSKATGSYGTSNTGPSANLMKMKFMQRGQEAEKRKQLQEDAQREKSASEWTKEGGNSVYVHLLPLT